ncbi:MAG: hypothetical protein M3Z19_13425, partial [Chloroflexota bacterium]|nr:hypothetical protein [Chloroflexota bacterium]
MDTIPEHDDESLDEAIRRIQAERPALGRYDRTSVHGGVPSPDLPEWGADCRGDEDTHGPPCWPLLEEPFAVLTSPKRSRWPKHLCLLTAQESLRNWAWGDIPEASSFDSGAQEPLRISALGHVPVGSSVDPRALFASADPMPVGRQSLQSWAEETRTVRAVALGDATYQPYDEFAPFMPFDGGEYATLILTARLPHITVTMFGLQQQSGGVYCGADMKFLHRYESAGANYGDVTKLEKNARAWWAQFLGIPVRAIGRGGRPIGSYKLPDDPGWLYAAYKRYAREVGNTWDSPTDPSIFKTHFLQHLKLVRGGPSLN